MVGGGGIPLGGLRTGTDELLGSVPDAALDRSPDTATGKLPD
jgi:hypothetical protein